MLKCLQLPLNKKKAHLLGGNYSKLFGFVVDTVISDPKMYINQFVMLKQLQYMPDTAASHYARLASFFLSKALKI